MAGYRLRQLEGEFALCMLAPDAEIPAWAAEAGFHSITRTATELSVLCEAGCVPDGVEKSGGWRGLEVEGPLAHTLTGVLDSILRPLAQGGISVLAIATYETDYIFLRDPEKGARLLKEAGHELV